MPRLLTISPFTTLPMKAPSLRRLLATLALGLLVTGACAAPLCDRQVAIDALCEIGLSELHPTQPAVGKLQVEERAAKLKQQTDFASYTSKHPIPVVQAPDGSFYLTDSHHLASALSSIGVDQVNVQVIGRLENPATFWDEMQARHWVYLYDQRGNPIAPSALPQHIEQLADDPYRALAGYAAYAGYYRQTDAYFMQFYWARYFGEKMAWQPIDRANLPSALQNAARLACQPDAQDLPGYPGPCPPGH